MKRNYHFGSTPESTFSVYSTGRTWASNRKFHGIGLLPSKNSCWRISPLERSCSLELSYYASYSRLLDGSNYAFRPHFLDLTPTTSDLHAVWIAGSKITLIARSSLHVQVVARDGAQGALLQSTPLISWVVIFDILIYLYFNGSVWSVPFINYSDVNVFLLTASAKFPT